MSQSAIEYLCLFVVIAVFWVSGYFVGRVHGVISGFRRGVDSERKIHDDIWGKNHENLWDAVHNVFRSRLPPGEEVTITPKQNLH